MRSKFFYTNLLFIALAIIITMATSVHKGLLLCLLFFFYILIIAAGCSFISWNFFLTATNKLPAHQRKQIALTFDDGPQELSATILDILKHHNIKASFFLIGDNVTKRPDLARRMLSEGHTIGNHSMHHGHLINLKLTQATIKEISECNTAIQNQTGFQPTLFRPPHGVSTHHLAWALEKTGLHSVGWSIRSFDTASKDSEALLNRLKKQLHDRAIILLHDFCPITAAVLPAFIEYARSQGFEFVAL